MTGRRGWVLSLLAVCALSSAAVASGDPSPMAVSPNWSGYVATGQVGSPISYKSVTGTWTVPTATCSGKIAQGGSSTVWVGLGGYSTKDQEEVGTDSNCSAKDAPIYYAWFELVPYLSYKVFPTTTDVIKASDTMTGIVKSLSISSVLISIQDVTRGWTFSRTIAFSQQDISSAEWIAEAPTQCLRFVCSQASLTNFGSVNFSNISATTSSGATGTLTDPDWRVIPIQLIPGPTTTPNDLYDPDPQASNPALKTTAQSPAGATPGAPSSDGAGFTITWTPAPGV